MKLIFDVYCVMLLKYEVYNKEKKHIEQLALLIEDSKALFKIVKFPNVSNLARSIINEITLLKL